MRIVTDLPRAPEFDLDDPLLYVSANTLDDPDSFPPTEVVWYSQKPRWFALAPTIPLHETVSPEKSDRAYNAALDRTDRSGSGPT